MGRTKPASGPLVLGFELNTAVFSRYARANDGYPPYNIELIGADDADAPLRLRITLAVAGFEMDELEILIESGQLIIRGRQEERPGADYLFRGIAARQFQRQFLLAEGMDVSRASLRNGLLMIDLVRPQPDREVRKINISTSQ